MTNLLLRKIYRNLIPGRLKGSIDLFSHLRQARLEGLGEKRVMVLAPHPDDDIIGCGGTLSLYHERGAEIVSVYMTDGRKGNAGYAEDELVAIRKDEAAKAAEVIGIDRLVFMENRDDELSVTDKTVSELSGVIREFTPESVFLPFLLDDHPDHMATNRIFLSAVKSVTPPIRCYSYGVWTPLPAFNVVVDVTASHDIKDKALRAHSSQLELIDLAGAVSGLSTYYSALTGGGGYTEVFLACGSDEYRRLGELIKW